MSKAKKKLEAEPAGELAGVMLWKATKPLTMDQHQQLRAKLEREYAATGIKIMLVPYCIEAVMADGKE